MKYFKISKILLTLPFLGVAIVTSSTLFPFIVGKYVWFRTAVDLALIFFLLGLLYGSEQESKKYGNSLLKVLKSPLTIAVSVFTAVFLLAGFFGVDPAFSFWSNFERGEGGLQILHLWLLFVLIGTLIREEKEWRNLLYSVLFGGILMFIYGFLAALGKQGFIGALFRDSGFRFQGSIGNPAYVAAYEIFLMFYTLYLLGINYKSKLLSSGAITLWSLLILFFTTFILAATRGAFIGLIVAVITSVIYLMYHNKKWRGWLLPSMLIMVAVVVALIYFKNTSFVKSIPGSRIFDISLKTKTFKDRAIIWQIAIESFKARPIFGWGPENFIYAFDRHFNIAMFNPKEGFGAWFDRAHNVFFDYLVETGIVGLLSYLSIFGALFWSFARKNKATEKSDTTKKGSSLINALMISVPIAYLVQGLVLFDVLIIYLNLFLFLALANYRYNLKNS